MKGTSLVVAKKALVARIAAVAALDGVTVNYHQPVKARDLKSASAFEAVWLGDASATDEVPILTGGHLYRDEHIDLGLHVQVLTLAKVDAQELADTRAAAIVAEIEGLLANDPTIGVTDPADFTVLFAGVRHVVGYLPDQGAGSRFDCTVRITARLSPT